MRYDAGNTQSRPPIQQTRRRRDANGDPLDRAPRATQARARGNRSGSRQGSRGRSDPSRARRGGRRPLLVPLAPMLVVLVACVLLAVLATRLVMAGKVHEARAEAEAAQEQVEQLTRQLSQSAASTPIEQTGGSAQDAQGGTNVQGGVEDPWVASKTFSSGDSTLDEEVKAFVDERVSTSDKLDSAALTVYEAIAWSEYVERDDAQNPAGSNWRIEYARKFYEHDCSGNCYEFAAFLMYCLQYLGFEDAHAEAVIVELQSGAWGDHGLVYVTNTDGSKCLCDTSLGTDGWMLGENSYNVQLKNVEDT